MLWDNIKGFYICIIIIIYVLQKDKIKKIMEKRIFVEILAKISLNLVKINKFIDYNNSANFKQKKKETTLRNFIVKLL